MRRSKLMCGVIAGAAIVAVPLVRGQAATQPATDSPKGAVKAFVTAQIKGDGPAIRAVLLTSNPTEERMAGAIADLAVAIADLDKAMVAKFGAAQTEPLMGDPQDALKANLDKLDKATEKVPGDTATVVSASDLPPGAIPPPTTAESPSSQDSMMLKRVDGQWKVSVTDLAKGSSSDNIGKTLASVDAAVSGYRSVLADLNGGKLTTVDAVAMALNAKLAPAAAATTAPAK